MKLHTGGVKIMKRNPVLTDQKLVLRLLKPEDIDRYYQAFFENEDEEVSRLTATDQHFTREQVYSFLKKIEADPGRYDFLIQYDGAWMGEIVLNDISEDRHAGFRIALFHSGYCNRGIGQRAMKLLFDFAFETLGLEEVELDVLTFNARAKHVYEKMGFQFEKTLPGEYTYHGEVWDADLMRLTRERFLEKRNLVG